MKMKVEPGNHQLTTVTELGYSTVPLTRFPSDFLLIKKTDPYDPFPKLLSYSYKTSSIFDPSHENTRKKFKVYCVLLCFNMFYGKLC